MKAKVCRPKTAKETSSYLSLNEKRFISEQKRKRPSKPTK